MQKDAQKLVAHKTTQQHSYIASGKRDPTDPSVLLLITHPRKQVMIQKNQRASKSKTFGIGTRGKQRKKIRYGNYYRELTWKVQS